MALAFDSVIEAIRAAKSPPVLISLSVHADKRFRHGQVSAWGLAASQEYQKYDKNNYLVRSSHQCYVHPVKNFPQVNTGAVPD